MLKGNNKVIERLKRLACLSRQNIIKMVMQAGEGHIASALSCVEILCALYFEIMKIKPEFPEWEDRDRFILSKGHGCAAAYSVLALRGFISQDALDTFGKKDSPLGGHPDMKKVAGIEVSTGSLGHGLSIGVGMSLAAKRDKKNHRVFVLLGDGECQEGSVWEAAMFAPSHKLDNLTAIVDFNGLQAIGKTNDVIPLNNFAMRWKCFGWSVKEVNGHDYTELLKVFNSIPFNKGMPNLIIAHTVKGKGVSFMENEIMWHARAISEEEYVQAVSEIKRQIGPNVRHNEKFLL